MRVKHRLLFAGFQKLVALQPSLAQPSPTRREQLVVLPDAEVVIAARINVQLGGYAGRHSEALNRPGMHASERLPGEAPLRAAALPMLITGHRLQPLASLRIARAACLSTDRLRVRSQPAISDIRPTPCVYERSETKLLRPRIAIK